MTAPFVETVRDTYFFLAAPDDAIKIHYGCLMYDHGSHPTGTFPFVDFIPRSGDTGKIDVLGVGVDRHYHIDASAEERLLTFGNELPEGIFLRDLGETLRLATTMETVSDLDDKMASFEEANRKLLHIIHEHAR